MSDKCALMNAVRLGQFCTAQNQMQREIAVQGSNFAESVQPRWCKKMARFVERFK
jgi:hypothetical protein